MTSNIEFPQNPNLTIATASAENTVAAYHAELGLGDQTHYLVELENVVAELPGQCATAIIDGKGIGIANLEGRPVGDALIKSYSLNIIRNTRSAEQADWSLITAGDVPREDTVYHLSGDEWAIILRGISSEQDLLEWKNRIQTEMDKANLGVYVGATLHHTGQTSADIFNAADQLMIDEKKRLKLSKLNDEGRSFVQEFGSKAISLGIDPRDLPALIELLIDQPGAKD